MSRMYECRVTVKTPVKDKDLEPVAGALESLGIELDTYDSLSGRADIDARVDFQGICMLCAGMLEEEFSTLVAQAIWRELGMYVDVTVSMLDLDERPWSEYSHDEDDYDEWLKSESEEEKE